MPIEIRPLKSENLVDAERIVRWAFGTKLGIPDPDNWRQGTSLKGRLLAEPDGAFGAFDGTELVGANFSIAWGSFGFFGPLVVHPKFWGNGIANQLMEPVMDFFERNVQHQALFTFSDSPLHIGLYQKFGYWPRFLTALMKKDLPTPEHPHIVNNGAKLAHKSAFSKQYFSAVEESGKADCLAEIKSLTNAVYEGLDLTKEVAPVDALKIGETILMRRDERLCGMAVCHFGVGSEADFETCYIKFAAALSSADGATVLSETLKDCTEYATQRGARSITAGVNMARQWAFQTLKANDFRAEHYGVAMHKPNELAYDRPDVFVIDDWR